MPINVTCECGKQLSAPDSLAGKKARCPACQRAVLIPAAAPAPPALRVVKAEPAAESNEYELDLPPDPPPAPRTPLPRTAMPHATAARGASAKLARIGRNCPACGAPFPLDKTVCPKCGFSANENRPDASPGDDPDDGSAKKRTGKDILMGVVLVILLLIAALAFTAYWFSTGPGAKFQITDIKTVNSFVAIDGLGFDPKGAYVPALTAPTPDPTTAFSGKAPSDLTLTGNARLILAQPDPDGSFVVLSALVSQGLLKKLKQDSNNDLVFRPNAWKILGPNTSLTPFIIVDQFIGALPVTLAGAQTDDFEALVPGHVKPASEDFTTYDSHNTPTHGDVDFDGTGGVSGHLRFDSFNHEGAAAGNTKGITAVGLLAAATPDLNCNYSFKDSSLKVSWDKGVTGWLEMPRYTVPMADSDSQKFRVILIFPRPKDDRVTISLAEYPLKTIDIAAAASHIDKPVPANAPPSGDPITRYIQDIANGQKKAKGEISDIQMNQIGTALLGYVLSNNDRWPNALKDVPGLQGPIKNLRTGELDGYLYVKPADTMNQIKDPAKTIIMYESKDGMPMPGGDVMFADAHCEKATK